MKSKLATQPKKEVRRVYLEVSTIDAIYSHGNLGCVDNSPLSPLRPAACPRDLEIWPNTQAFCTKLGQSGLYDPANKSRDVGR